VLKVQNKQQALLPMKSKKQFYPLEEIKRQTLTTLEFYQSSKGSSLESIWATKARNIFIRRVLIFVISPVAVIWSVVIHRPRNSSGHILIIAVCELRGHDRCRLATWRPSSACIIEVEPRITHVETGIKARTLFWNTSSYIFADTEGAFPEVVVLPPVSLF